MGSPLQVSTAAMYKATADDRGTIQALARQLDKAREDGQHALGPILTHISNIALP